MLLAAIIFAVALVIANSYVTWLVIKEDSFEPVQKFWQIVIIWFIPFVGAYLISYCIVADNAKTKAVSKFQNTKGNLPTEFDVLDNFTSSNSHDSFDGE